MPQTRLVLTRSGTVGEASTGERERLLEALRQWLWKTKRSEDSAVFSLLPSASIDVCDASDGYARRAACLQGGDEVQLSVYRDRKKVWWVVYEHEYQPVAKKPLQLQGLLKFALQRMRAASFEALDEGISPGNVTSIGPTYDALAVTG